MVVVVVVVVVVMIITIITIMVTIITILCFIIKTLRLRCAGTWSATCAGDLVSLVRLLVRPLGRPLDFTCAAAQGQQN